MNKLLISATLGILSAAAHGQNNGAYSIPGSCDAGTFTCDAVTVASIEDGKTLLQFTTQAGGHIQSYVGTADSEHVYIEGVYLDGDKVGGQQRQCDFTYRSTGELEQISCLALTFHVEGTN